MVQKEEGEQARKKPAIPGLKEWMAPPARDGGGCKCWESMKKRHSIK